MSRIRRADQPKGGGVAVSGGGTSAAPSTLDYLVKTSTTSLSAERVVTDTSSVTWDWSTAGQAKATVATMVGDSGAGGTKGLVPAPAIGDATKFLRGDATWVAVGALTDGDKGDIVVSGSGTSWLLDSTIAGTAGGRTIYGGNAADDDLHLYSTSHATKGYVYVHDDLVIGDAGTEAGGVSVNGTNYEAICGIHDIGGSRAATLHLHRHSTTLQNYLLATRSATEDSTHAALTNGDIILTMMAAGYTGSHYDQAASIEFLMGTGTISGTSSPGRIRLRTTPAGSQTPTTRIDILATGQVNVTNGLDVGGTLTAQTGDGSTPGLLLLGANGGALKHRDTAYAYVSRDSNGDASDLVASSAATPYAFQPVFAQLDSSGHPALLESWAPDPFFGGAYACLNAAAAATPSTSGVFVSAVTSGTVSNVTATYTDGHGWFRFATGTGPTSTAGVDAGGIYVCRTSQHWKVRSTFRVSSIAAAYTIWFVVANAGPSAPPTHYVGLRWIQGTDTNFQIVSKDGTTASSTDTGVAFAANTTYEVVMSWDGTTFTVSINGTTVTKTTNMPATTENLGVYLRMFKASGATNYSLDIRDGVQIARLQ